MLLEDASILHDTEALARLFADGALVVQGDRSARGREEVTRLVASTWAAGRSHVAGEGRILQARDLALVVRADGISVLRRGADGSWRYAIVSKGEP